MFLLHHILLSDWIIQTILLILYFAYVNKLHQSLYIQVIFSIYLHAHIYTQIHIVKNFNKL